VGPGRAGRHRARPDPSPGTTCSRPAERAEVPRGTGGLSSSPRGGADCHPWRPQAHRGGGSRPARGRPRHVTEFLQIDVDATVEGGAAACVSCRSSPGVRGVAAAAGGRRALLTAVARHPMINSDLGRGRAGDRGQALREPGHRPPPPTAGWSCRTSRARRGLDLPALAGAPRRSGRHGAGPGGRHRPTCPAARSPSPTSACFGVDLGDADHHAAGSGHPGLRADQGRAVGGGRPARGAQGDDPVALVPTTGSWTATWARPCSATFGAMLHDPLRMLAWGLTYPEGSPMFPARRAVHVHAAGPRLEEQEETGPPAAHPTRDHRGDQGLPRRPGRGG